MSPRPRSRRLLASLTSLVVLGAATAGPAAACTTFCLRGPGPQGRVVFGKNYDWHVGEGLLVVNQRGVARRADVPGDRPASWVSKYGSVTFNQYGRDFPSGGLNEAGLAIELMWLDGSRYPAPDQRPAVDVLQWIQYNLDTHRTVREVLAANRQVRIASLVPLHYLVADRSGAVATVEFLDGKLVAHTGKDLPVAALANSPYRESLQRREQRAARGAAVPAGMGSHARVDQAAERVARFDGQADPVAPSRPSTGWPRGATRSGASSTSSTASRSTSGPAATGPCGPSASRTSTSAAARRCGCSTSTPRSRATSRPGWCPTAGSSTRSCCRPR